MNLWIPQRKAADALGGMPPDVTLARFPPREDPPRAIRDAEFLVLGSAEARPRELLSQMTALRVIQSLSAGVDWLLPAVPAAVKVCDASGTRDTPVAEWVLGALLASRQGLPELRDRQRRHDWHWRRHRELAGSRVMILGYGSIGAAVERRLEPFGVRSIRVARHARPGVHAVQELPSLLAQIDALVVLLPLTDQTRGLLGAELLGRLPAGALLVNAARGAIVDTPALVKLLEAERIEAVLDVTDPEPLPPDHPLWDAPGVLITPHLAGDTDAAERRAFDLAGEQVRRYVRGEALLNVVHDGY